MNELFDKLILRVVFTLFICLCLVIYKYAHYILYPSSKKQMFKGFYPSKNPADTLHLFARILGIGIVFSEFYFHLSHGILVALFDFLIQAVLVFILYLSSIYIIESIVLYNFEYADEIKKRKNMCYSIITFSQALSMAFILKTIITVSRESFVMIIFLWLFSLVLIGFGTKSFSLISKLQLNRLIIQKNIPLSISYTGFIWGWTLIISSALEHDLKDIKWYAVQTILKILLSLIIFPIFRKGITILFQFKNEKLDQSNVGSSTKSSVDSDDVNLGYGIYEGVLFFTSCFLTSVIAEQIRFGTFYPVF